MIRLAIIVLLGFAAYRVMCQLYEQVPDDFEPVGVSPADSPD